MLHVQWSEDYRVGDVIIDEEHQSLVAMANRVFALADPQADREAMIEVVKELFAYMEYHFRHEEEIMVQSDYPHLLEHAQRHKRICQEMTQSLRGITDIEQYLSQLRHMIVEWVLKHMLQEDRRIGTHLKALRSSPACPVTAGSCTASA